MRRRNGLLIAVSAWLLAVAAWLLGSSALAQTPPGTGAMVPNSPGGGGGGLFPIGANTVLGSIAGGVPTGLSAAQLTTLCNILTPALSGCAPASGGGTANFLRADGAWAAPTAGGPPTGAAGGALSGTYPNPTLTSPTTVNVALVAGATAGDKIAACVAALPSTGGVCDARSLPSGGTIPSMTLTKSGATVLGPCGVFNVLGTIHIHDPGPIPGGAGGPISSFQWYGCGYGFFNVGTEFVWAGNAFDPMFSWQGTRETVAGDFTIVANNANPLAEGIRIETEPGAVSTNHIWRNIFIRNGGSANNLNFGMRWCTWPQCGATTRFNGSITGTTLTVNSIGYGAMHLGQFINNVTGSAIAPDTFITGFGSGNGGVGTYTVNNSQSVGTEEMQSFQSGAFMGTIVGTVLTVSSVVLNGVVLQAPVFITGPTQAFGIVSQNGPPPGVDRGAGSYNIVPSQTVSTPTMMATPVQQIGNNDLDTLYNVNVVGYGLCGYSIEGSQSKTHSFFNSDFLGDGVNSQSGVCTNNAALGDGGSFRWYGGGGGSNRTADFNLGTQDDYILIQGTNTESSDRFIITHGSGSGLWSVTVIGGRVSTDLANPDGVVVKYGLAGPLYLQGVSFDAIATVPITIDINGATRPEIGTAIGNLIDTTASAQSNIPFTCAGSPSGGCWNLIGNIQTDGSGNSFLVPNNIVNFTGQGATPAIAFADLPACGLSSTGTVYFIRDQNTAPAWHQMASGGGAGKQWVYCDGTNWLQQ